MTGRCYIVGQGVVAEQQSAVVAVAAAIAQALLGWELGVQAVHLGLIVAELFLAVDQVDRWAYFQI